MYKICQHIPNILLWNIISQFLDTQLNRVSLLTNLDANKSIKDSTLSSTSLFDMALYNAYGHMVSLKIDHQAARKEITNLSNDYISYHTDQLNNMRTKLTLMCKDSLDDDFIESYVTHTTLSKFLKSKLIFLQKVIDSNRKKIIDQSEHLKSHKLVMSSLGTIYDELERKFTYLRDDMMSLELIDEKIRYSDNYMKYLMQDIYDQNQNAKNLNSTTLIDNTVIDINSSENRWADSTLLSSFNSTSSGSGDKVLCSTKLESDNEFIIQRPKRNNLPRHVDEISAFLDIPFMKLSKMSTEK